MFRNYLLSALRNIRRNLNFTFLNVFGLGISIFSCLIIFLVVRNELNYDSAGKKAGRTYRVTLNALDFNSNVSLAVLPAMRNAFPELENSTQTFYQSECLVKIGQKRFVEKEFAFADDQFHKIFDLEWLAGNSSTALAEPNSIVLTETLARKYFGTGTWLGETINLKNQFTVKVTGVIKDPPANTSLPFKFLVSLNTLKFDNGSMVRESILLREADRVNDYIHKYVKLADPANREEVLALFDTMHRFFPQWVITTCPMMHPDIHYVSQNSPYVFGCSIDYLIKNSAMDKFFPHVHEEDQQGLYQCYSFMHDHFEGSIGIVKRLAGFYIANIGQLYILVPVI